VDETSIQIKKTWMYLSQAVDSEGNTREFLLSPTRDAEAAKQFFVTALGHPACAAAQASASQQQRDQPLLNDGPNALKPVPRVINVDKHAASPKAIADLKAMGVLPESVALRQVK
jgi:transposase, IS6 family